MGVCLRVIFLRKAWGSRRVPGGGKIIGLLTALFFLIIVDSLEARVSRGASVGQRSPPQPEVMGLWIDGKQIERFAGVPMDIYIIKNGAVVSYLQDAYNFDSQLPMLPPEIDSVELTWLAELESVKFTYKFSDLKSLDPSTLYDPLLSIPIMGFVPKKKSGFTVNMPCTGRVTGIASMYIVLHVYNSISGERVPGSPLKFHLRKRCVAFENKKRSCRLSCMNGGKCNQDGRCDCKPGYDGLKCELAVCLRTCVNGGTCVAPDTKSCQCKPTHYGDFCQYETGTCEWNCKNGGTCNHYNVCSCPEGYRGKFCQTPICNNWCGVHGKCVQYNLCECHRGWRGKLCNKTVKLSDSPMKDENNNNVNRKRRRRKLRHSSAPDPMTPFRFDPRRVGGGGGVGQEEGGTSNREGASLPHGVGSVDDGVTQKSHQSRDARRQQKSRDAMRRQQLAAERRHVEAHSDHNTTTILT